MKHIRQKKTNTTVWLAHDNGIEHGSTPYVFLDKDSALRWLQFKRVECVREEARRREYQRIDYLERAATHTDPDMVKYYREKAEHPDEFRITDIRDYDTGAAFENGRWQSFSIEEADVVIWVPEEIPDETD